MATVYPYTIKTRSLKDLFQKIQSTGTPAKFTLAHLVTLGLKSKNERSFITILKLLKFLDQGGVPMEYYKQYRDTSKAKQVLGKSIKEAYKDLFDMYPDAHRKDEETLRNFFTGQISAGSRVLSATAQTFKILCELASFDSSGKDLPNTPQILPQEEISQNQTPNSQGAIPININIELQIPATDDPKVYENFFKALKRYVIENDDKTD